MMGGDDDLVVIVVTQEEYISKPKAWQADTENKGFVSTRIRLCFWSLMLALMSSRNTASTPLLSAAAVSATTPSSARSACCGSTRGAVTSLSDCWPIQTTCFPDVTASLRPINARTVTWVDVDSTKLDVETTFCYLGDILYSSGGCDSAIAARCYVAWGTFRTLLLVLTTTHLSPKVCNACIPLAMLHANNTWGPTISDYLSWQSPLGFTTPEIRH